MYLLGVNIPDDKDVPVSLQGFYGIGQSKAKEICNQLSISHHTKLSSLSEAKVLELSHLLNKLTIESALRRQVSDNIAGMVKMGSRRGIMHSRGLPVNGQKSHYNAKTARKLNANRVLNRNYSMTVGARTMKLAVCAIKALM